MSDSSLVCVVIDGDAYVPMAEHEVVRRLLVKRTDTLNKIVAALDELSDPTKENPRGRTDSDPD